MNLLNAVKSLLQSIGAKTASDKANKGVMLVKTNGDSAGEPAGYVTKEVLAEIVRQELFSILSDGGNEAITLSKFIGLDGSSMKSITANNLASVLGVGNSLIKDIDTTLESLGLPPGTIRLMKVYTSPSGTWPADFGTSKTGSVILQMSYSSSVEYQVLFRNNLVGKIFHRVRQTDWGEWKEISFVN